jgi:hypothetical protein
LDGNREVWIEFCRKNDIAITDILKNIVDADPAIEAHRNTICKFKDDALAKFEVLINDIPAVLENHKSITQICITRQAPLPDFWEECFIDMFQYIEQNPERRINVKTLRSPSRRARRGVVGNFCSFIANRWIQQGYLINP